MSHLHGEGDLEWQVPDNWPARAGRWGASMNIENTIRQLFFETLEAQEGEQALELTKDTVLLESGLDSLGFAILVARLEEVLDFDPFSAMTDVVYPRTYGEFVEIYEKHCQRVESP